MMKTNTIHYFFLLFLFFSVNILIAQPRGGMMDPSDMVVREKQNIYNKLPNLTEDQKLLLEGIYDEYVQSMTEQFEEMRTMPRGEGQNMRTMMESLQNEKSELISDVLSSSQFAEVASLLNSTIDRSEGSSSTNSYGRVIDPSDDSGLIGATVYFRNLRDSTLSQYSVTGADGTFLVSNLDRAFYRVSIRSVGFIAYSRLLRVGETPLNIGAVKLEPDTKMLEQVEIKGNVVPVEQKGDTIMYNADAFKVNPDASSKDLVSKMPGIIVNSEGVSANGETVQQVLLDGKRFFGQDPLLSLNNIPAEVVKSVEVFDQLSEQSQFAGFNDGNTTKTMNIVTRENKRNGQFGKFYAGYGTDDLYKVGGNLNSFKDDRRLTIIGMSNNINQQNFSQEDLAGVSGGGFGGGRGGPPGGGGGNGGGGQFTGTQSGITTTHSIGTNYSDNWGDKVTIEGSYFFNKTNNSNDKVTNRESFLPNETQFYNEDQNTSTDNANHRLNARITYNINENNTLLIRPSISYQDNSSTSYTNGLTTNEIGEILNQTENNYESNNKSLSVTNNLTFQHKFEKIGRTLSLDLNTQFTDTDRENYYTDLEADSVIEYFTVENQLRLGSTVTYTEPVGATGQVSASYGITNTNRNSDKETYLEDPVTGQDTFSPSLSNDFESGYTTHVTGFNFSNRSFGKFYNIGISYQYATLNNDQQFPVESTISRNFSSVLPVVMAGLELGGGGNLFMRYSGSTSEPSINQLQNVIDNSNPLFLSLGNPELGQSYTHSLMMRFNKANIEKNTSLTNSTNVQSTSNYITTATLVARADTVLSEDVTAPRGAQLSMPINTDGFLNVSNNTSFSFLVNMLKSNMNSSIGVGYRRLPGETNGQENISNTYSANLGVGLVSNFSEKIDFNISYNISGNLVENSIQSRNNSHYLTQTVGGKLNLIFGKGWVFRNDIAYQKYNGINDASDFTYTLWNMSLAKKFLKNDLGELELSVFDLLRQNQSISQQVSSAYIQEVRTQVLQQYFMLTFTYQLRKFN